MMIWSVSLAPFTQADGMELMRYTSALALACMAIHISTSVAQTGGGFIFSGDQAVSAANPSQVIHVGERLSIAQLRKRFPGYSISPIRSDCGGTCIVIE